MSKSKHSPLAAFCVTATPALVVAPGSAAAPLVRGARSDASASLLRQSVAALARTCF